MDFNFYMSINSVHGPGEQSCCIHTASGKLTASTYILYCYLLLHFIGSQAVYGEYTEDAWPIHINDLNCTGSEKSVWECPHNGIEGYSCNHRQDASVICQGTSYIGYASFYSLAYSSSAHAGSSSLNCIENLFLAHKFSICRVHVVF